MILFLLGMLTGFVSCTKQPGANPRQDQTDIRPTGQPIGDAVSITIGSEGGSLQSADGKLEIEIPAGALAEPTEISIQAVSNTSFSGIGNGYRLLPHGKTFQKKATVRFYYGQETRRLSNLQALEIAFQNEQGKWICTGGTQNDTVNHRVAVQTDHFSDWSLISSLELTPVVCTMGLGEQRTLKAVQYVFPEPGDDLIVPLGVPNATNGIPQLISSQYITGWTLSGPGTLTTDGAVAQYKAPAAKPAQTTATVTCALNIKGRQVLLISTIHLIDEGLSISIDGGDWVTYEAKAVSMPEQQQYAVVSIRSSLDLPQIIFHWPMVSGQNGTGTWSWNAEGGDGLTVLYEQAIPSIDATYVSYYKDNDEFKDSPGFLSVEATTINGKKYVTGVFAIDKAGLILNSTAEQDRVSGIMGTFKVQRTW